MLNEIGSVEIGAEILGELISSENEFKILNSSPSTPAEKGHLGGLSFSPNEAGGGNILAGDISKINRGTAINALAHEGFHAYQSEFGVGKRSINTEVGAYLFGDAASIQLGYGGGVGLADNTRASLVYNEAYNTLLYGERFNLSSYKAAINNFRKGSFHNSRGVYNRFPVLPINPNPPIKKLFPLIR